MKAVVSFNPKMFLQREDYLTLAFAGKLVVLEGWETIEALMMACNYYGIEFSDNYLSLFETLLKNDAYKIVKVPNRLNGAEISKYIREKKHK